MMNNNDGREQPVDPRLIKKLALIGATPDRDPNLAVKGRDRFLAEVEGLPIGSSTETKGWLAGLFGSENLAGNSVWVFNRKFAFSTMLAVIVVGVMLFGGASATAFASQSALPGDALYPVKMGLEQTQISLANDAYVQAKLHLEFAQRRLEEITELLSQGRSKDVEFASNEFEYYIQQAMDATQTVMTADPERGAELSKLVSQALLDYAIALKAVLLDAPDPVKPVVEKALLFSQDGAGDEVEMVGVVESITENEVMIEGMAYLITDLSEFNDEIVVGDIVKIHLILTAEGTKIIREIELANEFDDNDENFGNNSNDDDTLPGDNNNDNDNDDGNENESEDNENESEDNENESEANENDNESNENENEDDSEGNLNENESEDDEIETKSADKDNENKSGENENESEDDEDEDKSEENDNENNNESDEEEEENENGD